MKPFLADMHMHTIMSGHAFGTLREMAAAAAEQGLKLIGVTEHAPGIPGTVDPIFFKNLVDAPRMLSGVEVMHGSEVNLLEGGALSLSPRHLACLDYAIVGIHGLCYENAGIVNNTDWLLKAMEDPKVRFVSHPDDDKFPLDYPALVAGAKEWNVALELNNSSLRKPSLRPNCVENYKTMIPLCMEMGVPVIVNTDSHDPGTVGDFTLARNLLSTMQIHEDLILSNDPQKMKAFLLGV